jgi:predicted RNA-binding protein with PIN domain
MSTAFLIDGYNLLHATGMLCGPAAGPHGLEKARRRLLGYLRHLHGDEARAVTVVFDAAGAPPGVPAEQDYHGLRVRFAVGHPEADDLIELLIREAAAPRDLHVVSDDHRIQHAARRRRCRVLPCADYLDGLERRRRRRPRPEAPEKGAGVSEAETARWLAEFGDLANDPSWKELFDAYPFEDE